jgi:hypothetical protein
MPVFGWDACPYGRIRSETGYTKRARAFSPWIRERQEKYKGIRRLDYPPCKMAIIGDYIYLPYAHMDMNEALPFLSHGGAFRVGCSFLPLEHWNVDTVISLLDFYPRAMMGGVISAYQKESVPKFLLHLREVMPDTWEQLIHLRPELDVIPNHIGRKAYLRTLAHPIKWITKHDKYQVVWKWNGTTLSTHSMHAYNKTWGDIELEAISLIGTPKSNAIIKVQSNDWVTEDTEFID